MCSLTTAAGALNSSSRSITSRFPEQSRIPRFVRANTICTLLVFLRLGREPVLSLGQFLSAADILVAECSSSSVPPGMIVLVV